MNRYVNMYKNLHAEKIAFANLLLTILDTSLELDHMLRPSVLDMTTLLNIK